MVSNRDLKLGVERGIISSDQLSKLSSLASNDSEDAAAQAGLEQEGF